MSSSGHHFCATFVQTPVAKIFSTPDEYNLLHIRALLSRLRSAVRAKGLYELDVFRMIDQHHHNYLTPEELYGGLVWLNINLVPAQVKELVSYLDKDSDGRIGYEEFKKVRKCPAHLVSASVVG